MNKIILNEKEFAENCLQTLSTELDTYSTVMILAKYFHYRGLPKKDIYTSLVDFLVDSKSIDYAKNRQYWENTCEWLSIKADKYALLDTNGVWITKKEFNKIKELNNKVLERLAFTLLCLAKYNAVKHEGSYWVNFEYRDIFAMARVTCKSSERNKKINTLVKAGYVIPAKQVDNLNLNVTFVDEETTEYSEENGDLFVYDFRELGYEYRKYSGEDFIRCAECGILTKGGERGTRRYCKSCLKYTKKPEKKEIICIDCGKVVITSKHDGHKCRCDDCQKAANRLSKREWIKQKRDEIPN